MKTTKQVWWPLQGHHLFVLFTLGLACSGLAQTSGGTSPTTFPVVSIQATDPIATWSGDTGTFTVFRAGDPTQPLNIYYRIGGTALNGVDYQPIGNWVQIPSGVVSNTIVITPINLGQLVTKTVTLQLASSPLMPPINYIIADPGSTATVYITTNSGANLPPVVRIAIPTNGAAFYTPVDIPICAEAHDWDGYVATVEFFAGTTSLGVRTNNPMSTGPMNPFCLFWSNAPAGSYVLTAKATDNLGASTVSAPVNIIVQPGPPPPPPTNFPPVVRIISPPNGAIFRAPVDIPIYAYARDFDGFVTAVEFFAGTNSLGFGHGLLYTNPLPGTNWPVPIYLTNLYVLVWSNAPAGAYALTAKATDNGGASAVSEPVKISILPPLPPPTNRPPIVSIVATDPIAIEGTNCWPWLGLASSTPTWSNWTSATAVCRFFTNCGPKNATFAVRRLGDTNDALTVSYNIGGTATNGVDYIPLPGSVTIPAGERRALITVVPLDDGPPDINSTVILKLTPSTDYVIGFPPSAAAIILDGPGPRPVSGLLPDKCFHLSAAGPDGAWFHVDYSTDVLNWTALCTNQVVNGAIDFVDPDAQANPARFYRAVPEANPPPE